jgi:hypothetical protein
MNSSLPRWSAGIPYQVSEATSLNAPRFIDAALPGKIKHTTRKGLLCMYTFAVG